MLLLDRIAGFTNLKRGITVNPGVIAGGTRSNVVAAKAAAEVDIRVLRLKDAPGLERKFRALRPIEKIWSAAVSSPSGEPQRPESSLAGTRSSEVHFTRSSRIRLRR